MGVGGGGHVSLRKKMALGSFWLFLEKGGQQLASFVVFTAIARIIGPEEYGLVALCGLFFSMAINIINGMVDAVISLRIRDDLRLSTLFWLVTACGAVLSSLSYVLAGSFAGVMGNVRLAPLLQCFSLLPFLLALAAVPTVLVSSSMNFRIFTIRTLIAAVVSGVIGIGLARRDFGAYAIAIQQIIFFIIMNSIVWPGCGWRPRFMFQLEAMSEILQLGFHQVGSSLVSSFEQQMPRLLLGYFIGPLAVGQYTFVLRICAAFQEILIQPLLSVIYPAFALVRDDHSEQKKILGQVIMIFGALIFPALALAVVTAPIYLPLLFGAKWEMTIPLLQLMLVASATSSLSLIMRDLLRAHKLIGAFFRWQMIIVLVGFAVSAALVMHGLFVFMAVSVVVSFIAFLVYTVLVERKTKIRLWGCYTSLWGPFVASLALFGAVAAFMNSALRPANSYLVLAYASGIGITVYMATYGALQYRQIKSLIAFIARMRKSPAEPKQALAILEE